MIGGETETQFLNHHETIDRSEDMDFEEIRYFYRHQFFLSDKNIMHHR